ncbi:unnamed protein product [Adineta steineri]|uniref:Uncharacterized protein n=1 Tax=Adineta steineri TaxID=433720 RepID=A0A814MTQ1_9BILA|nr:unnamed protein product [Adineta steineri]CAF3481187.1 unnamed protein product [Adineta steineri]
MNYGNAILICMFLIVSGHRESFDTKCKRSCNTQKGSTECWKTTTDGFASGLSAAMIDFCQVVLKVRYLTNETESWYGISRNILTKQIEEYEHEDGVRQLSTEDIKLIAISLLDKCFNSSSSSPSSEPSCPLCSENEIKTVKKWRLSSILLFSITVFFTIIIMLIYTHYTYHVQRSYVSVN